MCRCFVLFISLQYAIEIKKTAVCLTRAHVLIFWTLDLIYDAILYIYIYFNLKLTRYTSFKMHVFFCCSLSKEIQQNICTHTHTHRQTNINFFSFFINRLLSNQGQNQMYINTHMYCTIFTLNKREREKRERKINRFFQP